MIVELPWTLRPGVKGWKIGPTAIGECWVIQDGAVVFFDERGHVAHRCTGAEWEHLERVVLRATVTRRRAESALRGHDRVRVVRVESDRIVAQYRQHEIALRRSRTIKPTFCIVCREDIAKGQDRYVEEALRGACRWFQRSSWCCACVPTAPQASGLREATWSGNDTTRTR